MKIDLRIGKFGIGFTLGNEAREKNYLQDIARGTYGAKAAKPKEYNQARALDTMANEVWVYACVDLIAKEISGIPVRAWRKVLKAGKVAYEETIHPALELLEHPNEDGQVALLESLSLNCDLTGNRYMLLDELDAQGHPKALYSLISSGVTMVKDKTGQQKVAAYEYKIGSEKKIYKPEEIIHGKYADPRNDYEGLSPISAARLGIETMQEARLTNLNAYKNGARLDGYFTTKEPLEEEEYNRVNTSIKERYGGSQNSHKTPLLEGVEYKSIGIPMKDMEYIKGMANGMNEVCAIYKVPPILFNPEGATYTNLLEAQKFLYKYCIIPRLRYLQSELQRLADRWGQAGTYLEFDLSNVEALRANQKETSEIAQRYWSMGVPLGQLIEFLGLPFDASRIPGSDVGYLPFSVMPVGTSRQAPVLEEPGQEPGKAARKALPAPALKAKAWTPEQRTRKWEIFKDYTIRTERKVRHAYADFFADQEEEVIRNLEQYKSIGYRNADDTGSIKVLVGRLPGEHQDKAIDVDSVLFDYDGNVKKFKKVSIPVLEGVLAEAGKIEMDLLDLGISFDVNNPRVGRWLEQYCLEEGTRVMDSDISALKEILIAGADSGLAVQEMVEEVRAYYNDYELEGYKLERIVRTEVIGASNQGALESYNQAGIARKGWLSTRDGRARDTHINAEEDYRDGIAIDDDFHVGAGSGPAPGQIGLPEEDINCRCSIFPVIEE